jgi:hypothetical protein
MAVSQKGKNVLKVGFFGRKRVLEKKRIEFAGKSALQII